MGDGFASIAEDLLNYIREEQPKCGILALPLSQFQDDCVKPNANACALNDALNRHVSQGFFLHTALQAGTNMIIPIDVPLWSTEIPLHWNSSPSSSPFASSALIGASLHNLSFPYRAKQRQTDAGNFMSVFRNSQNPLCGLRISLPCIYCDSARFWDMSSTPFSEESGQFWTIRGKACGRMNEAKKAFTVLDEHPLPLPIPFPQFFDSSIQRDGSIGNIARDGDVESCSIGTLLHEATESSQSVVNILESMHLFQRKGRLQAAASYGIEDAEFREIMENLRSLYQ